MANIISWITEHWQDIASGICVVILFSSVIVKLTPSTKDNQFLGKIIDFLDRFSIAQTTDNKKYIEDAKSNIGANEKKG